MNKTYLITLFAACGIAGLYLICKKEENGLSDGKKKKSNFYPLPKETFLSDLITQPKILRVMRTSINKGKSIPIREASNLAPEIAEIYELLCDFEMNQPYAVPLVLNAQNQVIYDGDLISGDFSPVAIARKAFISAIKTPNANGLFLYRYYPKGTDMDDVKEELNRIEEWMKNNCKQASLNFLDCLYTIGDSGEYHSIRSRPDVSIRFK